MREVSDESLSSEGEESAEGAREDVQKYVISYTGRKQDFLRLHRTGGHLRPGIDVKKFVYVREVKDGDVHAFCKKCFRGSTVPKEDEEVDSEDELPSSEED